MSDDISHIAKEVLQTSQLTKEHVSELARLTAKQIYTQGYQAGEAANKIETWNEAIEAAASAADKYESYSVAYEIRTLKK